MRHLPTTLLLAAAMSIGGPAAALAAACAPYEEVVSTLRDGRYHERVIARAPSSDGERLLVVFAAEDGATWTAVVVDAASQVACVVAVGRDWQAVAAPAGRGS